MSEFVHIATSFPTALFSASLLIMGAYWVFTILGALDIEALDGLAGDIDFDLDLDLEVDAGIEAEVGEADAAEGNVGAPGAWLMVANALRLGRVPLTVTITLFLLGGWIASFLVTWAAIQLGLGLTMGLMAVSTVAAFVGAVGATNAGSRPLEPAFKTVQARSNTSLVGEVCEISTGRVSSDFGQANVTVDHDHLTIQVRCDSGASDLGRGSRALIVHFDKQREAFVVEPLSDLQHSEANRHSVGPTTTQREG